MAVVKIIIVLQRVMQMHVWHSNENSETEKGKTAACHTHTCVQIRMRGYTHALRCTEIFIKQNLWKTSSN